MITLVNSPQILLLQKAEQQEIGTFANLGLLLLPTVSFLLARHFTQMKH